MPIYKKRPVGATVPPAAERLMRVAARALLAFSSGREVAAIAPETARWVDVAGSATMGPVAPQDRPATACRVAQSMPSARLVRGWCLEEIRRKGVDRFAVVLDPHEVIEMAGGSLLCPTTPAGDQIRFLPDASLPSGSASMLPGAPRYNRAIFANAELKGSIGRARAFELTWVTNWGDDLAYSRDPRHARYVTWAAGDPTAFLRERGGLDPDSRLDVVMTSDLDELCAALMVQPRAHELQQPAFIALLQGIRDLHAKGVFKFSESADADPQVCEAAARSDTTACA